MSKLSKSQIICYSLLAFPLSFVGLPIYMNISNFYAREFGLSLTVIGLALIFVRLIDIIQDIFVGYASDIVASKGISRRRIIYYSSILLAISFFYLFNPPQFIAASALLWFIVILVLTYTFFNFAVINYEAIAAIISNNDKQRISINSAKEFMGLLGFLVAAIVPFIFIDKDGYLILSLAFALLILLIAFLALPRLKIASQNKEKAKAQVKITVAMKNKGFLFFMVIFLVNSLAVSFPSATIIFYVEDVLQQKDKFGLFLAIYFFSAISFIYFWKVLAQKFDKIKIWILSIVGSVITFIFAFIIGADNSWAFYLVCFFSGIFLGPDLITPPVIVASQVNKNNNEASSYFALYNMVSKIGLMLASSVSLLILGWYGYQPGSNNSQGVETIACVYALIPSLLKLIVIFLLIKYQKKIS